MVALDYFLYDNRTWAAGIGRDWGIKAATGALAARDDLRSIFDRYCGLLSGDRGYLNAFGQALGGVRPAGGNGYLFCVAVETSDSFGRPSWAVYGLWCPDTGILENVLAADAISAVQSAMRSASPPPSVVVTSPLALPVPRRLATSKPVFRRFDPQSTVTEVRAILLGAILQRRELPNILGITASARITRFVQGFAVVYCHPLDDHTQQVFEQSRSGEDALEILPDSALAAAPASRNSRAPVVSPLSVAVCLAVVALILWKPHGPGREAALRDIDAQLVAIRALDPRELHDLSLRGDDRRVRDACQSLIAQWRRIVDRTGQSPAAHVHERPDVQQLADVQWVLEQHPLGSQPCRVLQMAYPKDFEDPRSTARRWCDALAKLERTANAASGRTTSS